MSNLNPSEIAYFEKRLQHRRDDLRAQIGNARADPAREDFTEIIGQVRDPGEESLVELVATTNFTLLERETNELREVEAALERIREGIYGRCLNCDGDISRERLEAYPTATYCIDCEERAERDRGENLRPTL